MSEEEKKAITEYAKDKRALIFLHSIIMSYYLFHRKKY